MRSTRRFLLILAAFAGMAGCTSRTTPLPPPEVTLVGKADSDGMVTVTGFALEGASVGVVNDRTLSGVITTSPSDGCRSVCEFTVKLAAEGGDTLRVWQFFETESAQEVPVPKD
jgi:hypothetical protein